jgi:hypothetical protein
LDVVGASYVFGVQQMSISALMRCVTQAESEAAACYAASLLARLALDMHTSSISATYVVDYREMPEKRVLRCLECADV